MPACIMIASASLRVSDLPRPLCTCLAALDSLNPFLCRLGVDGGVRGACFAIGDSSLGGTDEPSSPSIVSVCTRRSPSQKRRSTLAFYVAQFVGRWHRDSLIYGAEDLALLIYDPIREGRETIMQAPPERDAVGRRGRNGNRAQPRDMFMVDLAALAASLNQAHLQSVGSLAEADEHCRSGVLFGDHTSSRAAPLQGTLL